MDEITIDGKTYISSKKAAGITGYAKDYVGQLCREGRVEARLIGRSWYVLEDSIRKHRFEEAESVPKGAAPASEVDENTNVEAIWTESVYTSEEVQMLPIVKERVEEVMEKKVEEQAVPVDKIPQEVAVAEPEPFLEPEMVESTLAAAEEESPTESQHAWESWFAGPKAEEEHTAYDVREREEVVPIHVMGDIRPMPARKTYEQTFVAEMSAKTKSESYLIHKAVAIAVIVLCLAVTAAGSGAADRFGGASIGIVDFLGGTSFIK